MYDDGLAVLYLTQSDRFKVLLDFLRGSLCKQGYSNDAYAGEDECGQKLVDRECTAETADAEFPDEYHSVTDYHTCDSALSCCTLPEQRQYHNRTEGCAEACPRK